MDFNEMERWITSCGKDMRQPNTYSGAQYIPHIPRVRLGYKQLAAYRSNNYNLTVHWVRPSSPQCYYLHLTYEGDGEPHEARFASVQAESLLPFLVRFGWQLHWSQYRSSFAITIPEREEAPRVTYPLWFTQTTVGYQSIWYTTQRPNELYLETLLWTEDGTPLVDDYKYFENIGAQVREIII